jgi:hypothetical protein
MFNPIDLVSEIIEKFTISIYNIVQILRSICDLQFSFVNDLPLVVDGINSYEVA